MRQRRPHTASLSDRPTSRARLTFGLLIVVRPCSKGEQTGFYTGAGSYDYQADHARRCVIVDGSATTLLPVRCCADGREGQNKEAEERGHRRADEDGRAEAAEGAQNFFRGTRFAELP